MSDQLQRLLHHPRHERVRSVLDSALEDEPSLSGMAQAARALGLGAGAALAASGANALAGTNALHPRVQPSPPPAVDGAAHALAAPKIAVESAVAGSAALGGGSATGVALMAAAKWLGVGVLAGGISVSSVSWIAGAGGDAPSSAAHAHAVEAAGTALTARARSPVARAAHVDSDAPATALTTTIAPQHTVSRPNLPARAALAARTNPPEHDRPLTSENTLEQETALQREVALLDRARRALGAGNARGALTALSEYDGLTARPSLGAEATLLHVQALVASGARSEAERVAREAIGGCVADGYARRLAKLAGLTPEDCSAHSARGSAAHNHTARPLVDGKSQSAQ